MDLKKRIQRIEDIEEIKKLKYTYAKILDGGYNPDQVAALFVEDGLWSVSGVGGTAKGRENIRKHSANLGSSIKWGQHNIFAPVIEVSEDGTHAEGDFYLICLLTMVSPESEKGEEAYVLVGKYHDIFVKVDGKWYFETLSGDIEQSSPWTDGWVLNPYVKEAW